ncbi:hypothetical protein GGU45_002799 [Niabella hirudinis]
MSIWIKIADKLPEERTPESLPIKVHPNRTYQNNDALL